MQPPGEFLRFYEALREAANREHLQVYTTERRSESEIKSLMLEAMGRSLQRHPATLPSVATEISIQGELWHVILSATAIPHFRATIVRSGPDHPTEKNDLYSRLLRRLTEDGDVGYCRLGNGALYGETWQLYLHSKIRLIKRLQAAFSRSPFRQKSALTVPSVSFPQLGAKLPSLSTLPDTPAVIREFLDACDRTLLAEIGEQGLSCYLKETSLSPATFLNAQHSLVSRIKAVFS